VKRQQPYYYAKLYDYYAKICPPSTSAADIESTTLRTIEIIDGAGLGRYLHAAFPDADETPAPQDAASWFCPHCGNDRPQFTVLINTPVQMIGVGVIQTAVLVCLGKLPGKDSEGGDILCRRVMTAQIVNLQLDSALLGAARRRSPMEI
jgi:hypothetical protein